MHALTVSAWPVFQAPGFDPWERKEFFAWLIRIGRRLAVLRGNRPALTSFLSRAAWGYLRGYCNLVDFSPKPQYRTTKEATADGRWYVTGGHARLPADGVPTEVTWAGASTPVPSRDTLPHGSVPAPVHSREIRQDWSPFTPARASFVSACLDTVRERLRGTTSEWWSFAPPNSAERSYCAAKRLLPFRMHRISPRFIMFHKALRTLSLSILMVGKCCVSDWSTSVGVNVGVGSALIAALIVSVIVLCPVACASMTPKEALTAWSNSLFFSMRLAISSYSRTSLAISPASFDCRLTNSGCIADALTALRPNYTTAEWLANKKCGERALFFRNDK